MIQGRQVVLTLRLALDALSCLWHRIVYLCITGGIYFQCDGARVLDLLYHSQRLYMSLLLFRLPQHD